MTERRRVTRRPRRAAADEAPARIDPRQAETIAPVQTDTGATDPAPAQGLSRPRRDPRKSKRRGSDQETPAVRSDDKDDSMRRVPDRPAFWVAAVSCVPEAWPGAEAELLGAAHGLAGSDGGVVLIRLDRAPTAPDAGRAGADRLIETGPGFAALLAALDGLELRHVFFAEGFEDADLTRRLAVRWGERPAFGVVQLVGGRVVSLADGGRTDIHRDAPKLLTLARNRFDPYDGPRCEARVLPVAPSTDPGDGLMPTRVEKLPVSDIPLTEASLVLSAGDGVTDWAEFHRLSARLDAAEAGSRQVCDAGHLPRSRQVGASGLLIEPLVYLAIGISGASQHLQGIQNCRFVVAVNTDLHAPMVRRADLAIVADAQQVMPALSQLLEKETS